MIVIDQPTIFPSDVIVRVSSANDGTMLDRTKALGEHVVLDNRRDFCAKVSVNYEDVILMNVIYDENQSYSKLVSIDKNHTNGNKSSVAADGLITAQSGVGMMLPIADCVATVLYDPGTRQMALLHLGRHSTVTDMLKSTFKRMTEHGSNISDILVWMSPNAQKRSYKLAYFDQSNEPAWVTFCEQGTDGIYVDLSGYNRNVCLDAGVLADHIEVSHIDTYTSKDYFSHSRGDVAQRFAVIATML